MSAFHDNALMGASGQQGYKISRSVRLRSSASAYFNRTLSSGNRQTWTWSGWSKRGALGSGAIFHSLGAGGFGVEGFVGFTSDTIDFIFDYNGGSRWRLTTTPVYRDPSAWYHIVFVADTTNATSGDRLRLYVNGTRITAFSTANYPTQNANGTLNQAYSHAIGARTTPSDYLDGYLTDINFIDGQALTPASFGETDSITGVWKPKKYAGTYGTNGFYLNFSDNSSNTSTTIGKDYSGNGNNWTPNNISVTAGATYDSMLDVPTPYADGSTGRGNYCVMNTLDKYSNVTVSNGNLDSTFSAYTGFVRASFALPSTGQWYWEGTVPTTDVRAEFGIATLTQSLGVDPQTASGCWIWYSNGTNSFKYNGSGTSWGTAWASGDIIGIAFDAGAGTLTFYKNNTLQGGGAAFTGLTGTYAPMVGFGNNTSTAISINFGQRPFTYTPPTGFVALNTQNLPAPTISNGAQYMAASTYTGNGATQSISNAVNGVSFQPDLVWVKSRSNAYHGALVDNVRGVDKYLYSSLTVAEETQTTALSSFNSNGFSLNGSFGNVNANAATYVGWQWKAGGTAVSNTSGSITSTVSAGATQGFSVVTWTGSGAAATVGHGLGVAPKMVIIKNRTTAASWPVYHASIGNTAAVFLNATNASTTSSTYFNNTSPTSSVFSVESATATNGSTNSMVAYCFAEVAGYSKFGSYTGNGSADGPFVFLGFRPRWVLVKRTDASANWFINDTSRDIYNLAGQSLLPNLTDAENTPASSGYPMDILSNGFKLRSTGTASNASGGTYIFMAVAENPFKLSLAR